MSIVKLTVITQSELGTFRTCRRKWELSNLYIPKRRPRALEVGSAAHRGFDAIYRGIADLQRSGLPWDPDPIRRRARADALEVLNRWTVALTDPDLYFDLSADERERLVEESKTASTEALAAVDLLLAAYGEHDFRRFRVLEVEGEFKVPLRGERGTARTQARLQGRRDVVLVDDANGALVLGEHKTSLGPANASDARVDIDGQLRAYLYSLRELKLPFSIGRVMLNVVRKQVPRVPRVNKDGKVSVAACDTTFSKYEAALHEQRDRGIPITDDQQRFLLELPRSVDRWVSRSETFVEREEVDQWCADALADASLIRQARSGKLRITRNSASCVLPWQPPCAYRSLCLSTDSHRVEADFVAASSRYPAPAEDAPKETA